MDRLSAVIKEEMAWFDGGGNEHVLLYSLANDERKIYAVTAVHTPVRTHPAKIVVQARIIEDNIVIDEDNTDRPLYQSLMERGIPREQIILAYVGEAVPTAANTE